VDLNTVTAVRRPTGRAELTEALGPGAALLAGGTFLFSQPQPGLHTLVDLSGMDWPALTVTPAGLRIAATCTLAELVRFVPPMDWSAAILVRQCCEALASSFKVWHTATVGGNICLALPAGPMTSLTAALDGVAVIWAPDGGKRRLPVSELVTGERRTALDDGEVLRAVDIPASALVARVAFRRAALAVQGRSGAVLIGRRDTDGRFVLTVTAATDRPMRLEFPQVPGARELAAALTDISRWFDDPHGPPDWRRAVTLLLAEEIRAELA